MQPLDQDQAQPAPLKAEQAWLLELKTQGRKAQQHRDWEKQVLYLKESDDDTRLDVFFELLIKRLDLPTAGMQTEDFPEWEKEHAEALAFLYTEPDLPEKCGPAGALTKEVRRLASALIQPAVALAPPEVAPLSPSQIEVAPAEIARLQSARNWLKGWFVAYVYVSVCFFALLVFSCVELFGMVHWNQLPASEPGPAVIAKLIQALILAAGAFGTLLVALVLGRRQKRKDAEFQQRQSDLQVMKTNLAHALNALRAEASQARRPAILPANKDRERRVHDLVEAVGKWRATVIRELVEDFFEQGLWMRDRLAERLKPLLAEIQRPFPTSCRAEAKELRDDQIESTFGVLSAVIASTITVKVDAGSSGALAQLIVLGGEPGVLWPSAAVLLKLLESERVLLEGDQLSENTASCMNEVLKILRS